MDALTTGINSVRGHAVQTAGHLMHWVGTVGDDEQLAHVRVEMLGEVECLLDIANEPSVPGS